MVCVVLFLDDFGIKYWRISLKFGTKVVGMRFYDVYSVFSNFQKQLNFIKVFPKISVFRNFGGQKLKILTFLDSHFAECVIFYLYCSFCAVCFKTFFGEFLNIEPNLVKIGVKWPHKNVNYSKIFRPNSTKFGNSMSNLCRIRYTKFWVDICNGFAVILEKTGGGGFCPHTQRGAC